MHETYITTAQPPERPGIQRLNKAANENGHTGPNAGSHGHDLTFDFAGAIQHESESEKSKAMRFALEEVYRELLGQRPDGTDGNDKLKNDILSHYRDTRNDPKAKVVLTIVTMDPNDRNGSFIKALDKLETFTEHSKKKLVEDAFKQLETLEPESGEADRLCDAIVDMRERRAFSYDKLDVEQQQRLGKLLNGPGIQDAIHRAVERYSTQQTSLRRPDVKAAFDKASESRAAETGRTESPASRPPGGIRRLGAARSGVAAAEANPAPQNVQAGTKPSKTERLIGSAARHGLLDAASVLVSPFGL